MLVSCMSTGVQLPNEISDTVCLERYELDIAIECVEEHQYPTFFIIVPSGNTGYQSRAAEFYVLLTTF